MQTITRKTGADLMAQWLATGGASDAAPARAAETAGDDRLAAHGPTSIRGGCYIDDGLATCYPTFSCHTADDGLQEACEPSFSRMCFIDDGLAATSPTSFAKPWGCPFADDGLAATGPTSFGSPYPGCAADDGLQAGGYTTSFCPVMAPEQQPAA